eukprot:scaffold376932_cov28-Attheya_sp.AAC.2
MMVVDLQEKEHLFHRKDDSFNGWVSILAMTRVTIHNQICRPVRSGHATGHVGRSQPIRDHHEIV